MKNFKLFKNKIDLSGFDRFFVVNAFNNNYYTNNLPTDSFTEKIVYYYKRKFKNFVIYDYNSEIVKEFFKTYKNYVDILKQNISYGYHVLISDMLRLYILSKIPYSLYIDDDVIIDLENVKTFLDKPIIRYNFSTIYNHNNLDLFSNLLNFAINRNTNLLLNTNFKYRNLIDIAVLKDFYTETNNIIYDNDNLDKYLIHYGSNYFCLPYLTNNTNERTIYITNKLDISNDNVLYNVPMKYGLHKNFPTEIFQKDFIIDYYNTNQTKYLLKEL